ncbi:MAG: Fic family protein, partial [Treponema sp.]|nr:Fic family protein [Treponema sp.]
AIHPFREGNGRTQRLFITFLARSLGWELDFSSCSPAELLNASIESFSGSLTPLQNLIFSSIKIANV